jgi:hypothetical protein
VHTVAVAAAVRDDNVSLKQVVFELYMAKPGLAGLPTKELLVGWTVTPLMQGGQVGG